MEFSKTLVFLHGGPGYEDYLKEYFEDEFNYNVESIFYTQAHGPDVGVPQLLEELHERLKGKESPYLVGHSWGGVLAQEYLKTYSENKVKGLVLISSFVDYAALDVAFKEALNRAGIDHPTLSKVFYTNKEAREAHFIREKISQFDSSFFKKIHHDFLDSFHGEESFKTIDCPILNIFGTQDLRTPPEHLRTFAELNSLVQNIEIRGAGHFPFILPGPRGKIITAIRNFVGDFRFRIVGSTSELRF